ncbi:MAG: AI-2E family transporter [Clostridium sp.]|uniref:AI-2E family transporter n=1 Tax=Clostridium TaxID=1485 RepID=UPI00215327F7|nr:AI-2E family transporter [Clostridium sp. LY3-2]MCR6515156.1 AI-2E family transporter [Clostridium sp. LY3-2]
MRLGLDRNIKIKDIILLVLVVFVGYEIFVNHSKILDFIGKFFSVIMPFIYAFVFAYVLNPIMKLFQKRLKLKRGLAVLLTYVLVTGIIVLVGVYVVPVVIDSIISITTEVPKYITTVQGWINSALQDDKMYTILKDAGVLNIITNISTKAGTIFISLLEGLAGSLLSITADIVMIGFGFLCSIYVLADKDNLIKQVKIMMTMVFKKEKTRNILGVLRTYNQMIGLYIGSKALDSLIIGIISLVGLIIFKVPYAILLAIIVGFTNMIPYFGPFVGMVVCATVSVFVSPMLAIIVFVFLLAVQQFDAWFLEPKIVGSRVGISPFLIILGVTIGGGFFGAIGMLLASPTVATIKVYYDKLILFFKSRYNDIDEYLGDENIKELNEYVKKDKTEEDSKE